MHLSKLFAGNLKALEIKIFSRKYYHEYIYIYVRTIAFNDAYIVNKKFYPQLRGKYYVKDPLVIIL